MFYETSFLLFAILFTAVLTRYMTVRQCNKSKHMTNRYFDIVLRRKFFMAKLMIIFLFCLVLMLWAKLPIYV
jgi:hypothetical protein